MTERAWRRAHDGHPTVVVGHPGPAPADRTVLVAHLDRPDGLAPLGAALSGVLDPLASELTGALGRRLLCGRRPDAFRPPLFVDENVVAVLHGAHTVAAADLARIRRWIAAPRCALVFQSDHPGPVADLLRERLGEAAVDHGPAIGPASVGALDRDGLLLLFVALDGDGTITVDRWATETSATPLAALAHLEVLARRWPLTSDTTGYTVDPGWLDRHRADLGPATREWLPSTDAAPALDFTTAFVLGDPSAAHRATTPMERAIAAWALGTPHPDDAPALVRLHLAWDQADDDALDAALRELPPADADRERPLLAARRGERLVAEHPWTVAALPLLDRAASVPAATQAVDELLAGEVSPREQARLVAWKGHLAQREGHVDEAAGLLGQALPLLHAVDDGPGLAEAVAMLTVLLDAEAASTLVGWLEAAVVSCADIPDGLASCARALDTLHTMADATDTSDQLRRLTLQLGSLRQGRPPVRPRRRSPA